MLLGFGAKLKFDPSQVEVVVISDFELVIGQGKTRYCSVQRKSHLLLAETSIGLNMSSVVHLMRVGL